jgi:hypothetical protein
VFNRRGRRGFASRLSNAYVMRSTRAGSGCPKRQGAKGWPVDRRCRCAAPWAPCLEQRMGVCVSTEPDFASGLGGSEYRTTEEAAAGTNVEFFARGPGPRWMSLGHDLERAA